MNLPESTIPKVLQTELHPSITSAIPKWTDTTSNGYILDIVKYGYKLNFTQLPKECTVSSHLERNKFHGYKFI